MKKFKAKYFFKLLQGLKPETDEIKILDKASTSLTLFLDI